MSEHMAVGTRVRGRASVYPGVAGTVVSAPDFNDNVPLVSIRLDGLGGGVLTTAAWNFEMQAITS